MEFERVSSHSYYKTVLLTMMMFKWGIFCTETLDKCLSSPCKNNATCIENPGDYFCLCPEEPLKYVGKNCEELYDACSEQACPRYRNCTSTPGTTEYNCSCPLGFTGTNCTININECESNPCSGYKTECVDGINGYTCQCPNGYTGDRCQTQITNCLAGPCHHNGTCVDSDGGYQCECSPGFSGGHCEVNIDECLSLPCKNGAICLDGINEYHCFCVPGFQGYNCEIDINECASRPCENNGTCINEKDRYVCECLVGYTGVNCEVEINECASSPCQNGATCVDHVGHYTCVCLEGYEGLDCEVDVDECSSQPCQNGGSCSDLVNGYNCLCADTGYMGDNCEIDIPECASNPCHSDGVCVEGVKNYSCLCWNGYEGHDCEIDVSDCAAEPCANNGLCYERSNRDYYGTLPEFEGEFSYATAAGYICKCQPGFTGENCSVNIDECASMPCLNGGTCEDHVNYYTCRCQPGFTGVECGINIDECESSPCHNGGVCEDGTADYTCHCPPAEEGAIPWGGKDCEIQMLGCENHACENGAQCRPTLVDGNHGYTCVCPPGFYGTYCSTPTTFSFSSRGYIVIEPPESNRTKRGVGLEEISISMRFRSTLPNMILFYRGDQEDFLYLEISEGHIHAKSVLNGIASEVYTSSQVNDGQWHKVGLTLHRNLTVELQKPHCVSEDCTELRTQPGDLPFRRPESFKKMFIGGVSTEGYLNRTESRSSFIGCIEDLMIDSWPVLPQDISKDLSKEMMLGCSKNEWCHPNPCSNNGLCIDLWTTFQCNCLRPFYGDQCLDEYKPATFSLEDSLSYASFNITKAHGSNFSVSFFLRSLKADGLVFQLRNAQNAYFTLYLNRGRMHVQTLSASSVVIPTYITSGVKQLIIVKHTGGNVLFNHSQTGYVQLSPVPTVKVQAGDVAYIGGHNWENETEPWGGFFKGCLQDVRLDDMHLEYNTVNLSRSDFYSLLQSKNVSLGCISDDTCQTKPCENGGVCNVTWNDFVCSCAANFTGRICETRVWCSSSPCPAHSRCVDLPGGYECAASATFEENAAIKYTANRSLFEPVTKISLDLRTRDENAVLLHATNGVELFCIGLRNSTLVVKFRTGNNVEVLSLVAQFDFSDGLWHEVHIHMAAPYLESSRWIISIDDERNITSVGSAGNLNFLNESIVSLAENFTGCLGNVRVGGLYLPFADGYSTPQRAKFTKLGEGKVQTGCTGSPVCSSQPCLNNGVCEDLFNLYECNCSLGWEGQHCQFNTDDCQQSPCLNGKCVDLLADYRCDCYPGYSGRACDVDIDDCSERPCQNGGSCTDGINGFTCVCTPNHTGLLCELPYPALQCGDDVECFNGGTCVDGIWGANCTCGPDFTGDRCETVAHKCFANPCQNGGSCRNLSNTFQCICGEKYSGRLCETNKQEQKDNRIPLIVVAVPVACGCVLLVIIGLIFMVLTARKKRQSEGTYSPSQQEVAGARLEMDSVLKVPPEERLI